jgi:cyclopropane-fatty-acyl-phospholipid synthase
LKDGQTVLELGCGWGSLCLYLAEQYPRSEITAVSNSKSQKQLIMQRAKDRRLKNLKVCCSVAQLTLRTRYCTPACAQVSLMLGMPLSQLVVDWQVITADVVEFDAPAAAFDRVMSIEMFEHMKNYGVSNWGG